MTAFQKPSDPAVQSPADDDPGSLLLVNVPPQSVLYRQAFAGGDGKEVNASELNYSLFGRAIPNEWAT